MNIEERLNNLSDEKLLDVVKNHRKYGYEENTRNKAIEILNTRGIDMETIIMTGNSTNSKYFEAEFYLKRYINHSKIALFSYFGMIASWILAFLFGFNVELIGIIAIINSWVLFITTIIMILLAYISLQRFDKASMNNNSLDASFMFYVLGIPFYVVVYYYFKNKLKEQIKNIS